MFRLSFSSLHKLLIVQFHLYGTQVVPAQNLVPAHMPNARALDPMHPGPSSRSGAGAPLQPTGGVHVVGNGTAAVQQGDKDMDHDELLQNLGQAIEQNLGTPGFTGTRAGTIAAAAAAAAADDVAEEELDPQPGTAAPTSTNQQHQAAFPDPPLTPLPSFFHSLTISSLYCPNN